MCECRGIILVISQSFPKILAGYWRSLRRIFCVIGDILFTGSDNLFSRPLTVRLSGLWVDRYGQSSPLHIDSVPSAESNNVVWTDWAIPATNNHATTKQRTSPLTGKAFILYSWNLTFSVLTANADFWIFWLMAFNAQINQR